jgi:hypothetical protein
MRWFVRPTDLDGSIDCFLLARERRGFNLSRLLRKACVRRPVALPDETHDETLRITTSYFSGHLPAVPLLGIRTNRRTRGASRRARAYT